MQISSLKRKFIIFAIIIITPIATSNIISLTLSSRINDNYNKMLYKISITSDIKNSLSDSYMNFNKYVLNNTDECKQLFESDCRKAIDGVIILQTDSDTESRYILRDLLNSLVSYRDMGESTIKLYSNQKGIDAYYDNFVATKEISSYCNTFISRLVDSYINNNNIVYTSLKEKQTFIYKVLVIYIITAIFMSFLYTFFFLKNILDKLHELVEASQKVSKGDFSYHEGKRTNLYELDILSEAFSTMIKDIKKFVNSIKKNAELEIELLKYENAFKQSQLKVLQSQINPHFLFNTLNCINQTAIKENAEQTESLIRSVSGILRYSLSMMDKDASLEEEINVVKQYIFIQELRFEDRVKFNINIDADTSRVRMPGMTLQPFVENAFIHGIEPKEEGGAINIDITEEGCHCIIRIEDNGCGIDEETLEKIKDEEFELKHTGHTTGMGVRSVVKRLELMYDNEDLFTIESKLGQGTTIWLKIPIKGLDEEC